MGGLVVTLALAAALVWVPASSATTTKPRWTEDSYHLRATWLTRQRNEPEVGQITDAETTVMVVHGRTFRAGARGGWRSGTSRLGTSVCLIRNTLVSDSATGETLAVVPEKGCAEQAVPFAVAGDGSTATLSPTPVEVVAYEEVCPPGEDFFCDYVPVSTRTVTVATRWTAIAPSTEPFSFCFRGATSTYRTERPAVATGSLDGESLGESIPNDIYTWLYHLTKEAGCGRGERGGRSPDHVRAEPGRLLLGR